MVFFCLNPPNADFFSSIVKDKFILKSKGTICLKNDSENYSEKEFDFRGSFVQDPATLQIAN
jgi:hypothetical protein